MSHVFDRDYFNGGAKVGGYAYEGYWDYPVHHLTAQKVLDLKPESVLELGAARGYILKRLEDSGVRVKGLEISEHCRLTRAIDDIETWDITKTPWPVADKAFDLCFSIAVLEHIPEDKLPAIFSEMARTCKRGLHGIDLHDDDGFDKTHVCIRPLDFWLARLPPDHVGVDKEDLERGQLVFPQGAPGVKLNIGSFTTMFHYGWRNLDVIELTPWARQHGYSFSRVDVRAGLPFDDDVVDMIFSCHMLEHLNYDEGASLLKECQRVLKPGGVIRVLVPDVGGLIVRYNKQPSTKLHPGLSAFDELSPQAAARTMPMQKLYELAVGGGHQALYDWKTLHAMMESAGFDDVQKNVFRKSRSDVMRRETTDLYPELSLIAEATIR